MKRVFVLLFSLVTLPLWLCAQPRVERQLSRDSVEVGDSVLLTLKIATSKGAEIYFPQLSDTLGGGLEVYAAPRLDTLQYDNEGFVAAWKLPLVAYDTGWVVVPDLPVLVQLSGRADTLSTGVSMFHVAYVPMEASTGELADIRGPLGQGLTFREVFPWLLAGLGVVLLSLVIYFWWRYRKTHTLPFVPVKPPRPAEEVALERLRALGTDEAWRRRGGKYFYTELTEALRVYLGATWHVRTLEETTSEILVALRGTACTEAHALELQQILERSDLVKFARFEPLESEGASDLTLAIRLVEEMSAQVARSKSTPEEGEDAATPPHTTIETVKEG